MQNIKNITTQELEQILQDDIAGNKEYDTDFIMAVLEELVSRQPKDHNSKTADQAYRELMEHYTPK